MNTSKNEAVQSFLDNLKTIDEDMFDILRELRKIIFDTHEGVEEKMMYGGIIFSKETEMFGGLFAYKKHVSLEFSQGYLMKDPNGILEGKGKYRRHLKVRAKEEINDKDVAFFVKQAV